METTKLPPHKAAAARKRAEKEKAELDHLVEGLPPHKKAATLHQMAAKKIKDNHEEEVEELKKEKEKKEQVKEEEQKGKETRQEQDQQPRTQTDQAQRFDATFRYRRPGSQKKKVQEKSIETSQTLFRPTVFVVPESFNTEVVEEVVVPENAATTTTIASAEATLEKEDDMDEALTDIAEIERDIALARTRPGLEADRGCQKYHYRENEDEEIDERDAYQVAYGRSFVKVSGKKAC